MSAQTKVGYAKGCDVVGDSTAGFQEAVDLAKASDVAIVFVGEIADMVGEAASRARSICRAARWSSCRRFTRPASPWSLCS